MLDINYYSQLKLQFDKKFHIIDKSNSEIGFYLNTGLSATGNAKYINFVVQTIKNGKIHVYECSYLNERPKKGGMFVMNIIPCVHNITGKLWIDERFAEPFTLAMTTNLNALNIDTLLDGFNLADQWYKDINNWAAPLREMFEKQSATEEDYAEFKDGKVIMTPGDSYYHNKIELYDLKTMFETLGHYHVHNGVEHVPAYISDQGLMALKIVNSFYKHN